MWGLGTYGNLGNSLYNTSVEPVLVGAEEAGLDEYDIILHLGETHQITVTNKTFNVLKRNTRNRNNKLQHWKQQYSKYFKHRTCNRTKRRKNYSNSNKS